MLHGLDNHDGVVNDQANGQYQAEQRQRVHGKPEQGENHERANQRDRHRQQRDERRTPALQKDIYNQNNE